MRTASYRSQKNVTVILWQKSGHNEPRDAECDFYQLPFRRRTCLRPSRSLARTLHWTLPVKSTVKYTNIAVRSPTCHNATATHIPYRITQCYPPPDRGDIFALTPTEAVTRLRDPGGMQGWVELVGWLHTEIVYPPEDGHPPMYTNRARRVLTWFMRRTSLTTTPRRQQQAINGLSTVKSAFTRNYAAADGPRDALRHSKS